MNRGRTERLLRGMLLGVLVVGMAGTGIELLLLEHHETAWQFTPIVGLGAGLLSAGFVAVRPGRSSIGILRALMALFVLSGLLGLYLHFKGNREFELEMYPSMTGFELFKESMMGATPALAPGTMVWLGLLGLAFVFRHPQVGGHTQKGPLEGDTP